MIIEQINKIQRYEIPSLERRGGIGFMIKGELVIVKMNHGSIRIETSKGVPIDISESMIEYSLGVSNLVMLGSYYKDGIVLIDLISSGNQDFSVSNWRDRWYKLKEIMKKFPEEMNRHYKIAVTSDRGLLSAYDLMKERGGGLLIKLHGNGYGQICY